MSGTLVRSSGENMLETVDRANKRPKQAIGSCQEYSGGAAPSRTLQNVTTCHRVGSHGTGKTNGYK
jgi:hypothetical protein